MRTREAIQVDCTQKPEEPHAMFGEFGEILINHIQRGIKHRVHDSRYLRREQWLRWKQ